MTLPVPNRIYAQYRTKPKAVQWYNITRELGESIYDTAQAVRRSYNIISGKGEQLDNIGRIVVIPREFILNVSVPVPQFNPDGKNQFGETGSQFSSTKLVKGDSDLANALYRLVILAKIIRNTTDATIENIVRGLNVMLGESDAVVLTDNEDMTFDLHFLRPLTDVERSVIMQLDIIAKPAGVRIGQITEAP